MSVIGFVNMAMRELSIKKVWNHLFSCRVLSMRRESSFTFLNTSAEPALSVCFTFSSAMSRAAIMRTRTPPSPEKFFLYIASFSFVKRAAWR